MSHSDRIRNLNGVPQPEPYAIEKNVPPPEHHRVKYPFRAMAVGDSFAFRVDEVQLVRASASSMLKRHGLRFRVRKVSDTGGRCWRIE